MKVLVPIQAKRGTLAGWTALNPIPLAGEICFVTDQNKVKIGDGTTSFNALPYLSALAVPQTGAGDPNGSVSGQVGEMYTQVVAGTATIWVNTTGGTVWV